MSRMREMINENTIVTLNEVAMDYVYLWGLEVPIVDALSEISKKQKSDGYTSTYHICAGWPALDRICSIAMNNIRFDEGGCFPDVQPVAGLLTKNGMYEFKIIDETWSLEKSMLSAGMPKEKVDSLLNKSGNKTKVNP